VARQQDELIDIREQRVGALGGASMPAFQVMHAFDMVPRVPGHASAGFQTATLDPGENTFQAPLQVRHPLLRLRQVLDKKGGWVVPDSSQQSPLTLQEFVTQRHHVITQR